MKYYLRITQILEEDNPNVPETINIEVDNKDDAISKKTILAQFVSGEKKVEFITCRHEEGMPCTSENI